VDERTAQRRMYPTPKLQYIMSPRKMSIQEISDIWHEKHGDGYAVQTLRDQCASEGWPDQRTEYQAELEEQVKLATQAATGMTAEMIAEDYVARLERQLVRIEKYLDENECEFRDTRAALQSYKDIMAQAGDFRGLKVVRFEDMTGKERPLKELDTAELLRRRAAGSNGGARPH